MRRSVYLWMYGVTHSNLDCEEIGPPRMEPNRSRTMNLAGPCNKCAEAALQRHAEQLLADGRILPGCAFGKLCKRPMGCTFDRAWHTCMLTEDAHGVADVPCAHQTEALLQEPSTGVDDSDSQGTQISAHVKAKGSPSLLLSSSLHPKRAKWGACVCALAANFSRACCGRAASFLSPQ